MKTNEKLISALIEKYNPLAIILYGSYADGTDNAHSDFDVLLITEDTEEHNIDIIDGIQLDAWVYRRERFEAEYDPNEIIQIYNGKCILDYQNIGQRLLQDVNDYVDNYPLKERDEIADELAWCSKMVNRAKSNTIEGLYRAHWLLTDFPEIYADVIGIYFRGPKKTIRHMEQHHLPLFECYTSLLKEIDAHGLEGLIDQLTAIFEGK